MISKKAMSLIPYIAGEQPRGGFIKLNTNENPYPPSKRVAEVLKNFDAATFRLYPDPNSAKLTEAIAEYEGVSPRNIFLGNGSDEVLGFAFLALFENSVAFADVTYSFYPVYCDLYCFQKKIVPLNNDFSIDLEPYKQSNCGGIVLANPNAPTSLSVSCGDILRLAASVSCNVLVDEAYIDFSTQTKSLAKVAAESHNLLVVKTFSKSYSLAGLRCGYAVGSTELVEGLSRVKNCFNSYTLDTLCQKAVLAAVTDREYFATAVQSIVIVREKIVERLKTAGHTVLNSDANFLFVKHKKIGGEEVYKRLKEQGILVRHFKGARTDPYVRVTIGTDEEMGAFLKAFNALF